KEIVSQMPYAEDAMQYANPDKSINTISLIQAMQCKDKVSQMSYVEDAMPYVNLDKSINTISHIQAM
ncbi:hypothetical protein PJP14_29500, partial [Mycobacterium kansasii]